MPNNERTGFLTGLLSGAALTLVLIFIFSEDMRKQLKPLIKAGMNKSSEIMDEIRSAASRAKEHLSDLVEEARFEAVKEKISACLTDDETSPVAEQDRKAG